MRQKDCTGLTRFLISIGTALLLVAISLGTLLAAKSAPNNSLVHKRPVSAPLARPGDSPNQNPLFIQPHQILTHDGGTITDPHSLVDNPGLLEDLLPPLLADPVKPAPIIPEWVQAYKDSANYALNNSGLISLSVIVASGSPDAKDFVFNGDAITYTILLTNNSNQTITDVLIIDLLPHNAFADNPSATNCPAPDCVVTLDSGGRPQTVKWTLTQTILAGQTISRTFRSTVVCQPDGGFIDNEVIVSYRAVAGIQMFENELTTMPIQVKFTPNGTPTIAIAAPTWCSDEGAVRELDWGDFDRDGDLDLALALLSEGVSVYRNNNGELSSFWNSNILNVYDAKWVDVDNNGILELILVRDCCYPDYQHYIYESVGDHFIQRHVFTSEQGIRRIAPADYTDSEYVDLATLSLYGFGPCAIHIFENNKAIRGEYGIVSPASSTCIAHSSTFLLNSIEAADYDNDGDPDIALGEDGTLFFFSIGQASRIFKNNGRGIFRSAFTIEKTIPGFGLAWGDYSGDGYLDLALASKSEDKIRIYEGEQLQSNSIMFSEFSITSPLSTGWSDYTGDGNLELIMGGTPPKILRYNTNSFTDYVELPDTLFRGFSIWRSQGVDYDNDGDLDMIFSNNIFSKTIGQTPTILFDNFATTIDPTITTIRPVIASNAMPAGSIAWGDVDNDGDLDLLLTGNTPQGGTLQGVKSKIYLNINGRFDPQNTLAFAGAGLQIGAFGDADNNHKLDVALGTLFGVEIYRNGNATPDPDWSATLNQPVNSVAWGDADFDDDTTTLELLVSTNRQLRLFARQSSSSNNLQYRTVWSDTLGGDIRSVAWGYYDRDHLLDFAVGQFNGPNYIYRNDGDWSFSPVWSSTNEVSNTTSIAWGDYDRDGDLDLAVGNEGEDNLIYENLHTDQQNRNSTMSNAPVWKSSPQSPVMSTTSIAWGDYDRDGDLDLAVGNAGQADQVFDNRTPVSGEPKFDWLWTSVETRTTTGVAWGDIDGDGDLDLGISQGGIVDDDFNGYYENNYMLPAHLDNDFAKHMPLPNNPTYLSVDMPGNASASQFHGSAELLSGPLEPTVSVNYHLFDPDGSRVDGTNEKGTPVYSTTFEYSLDGGDTWQIATSALTNFIPITETRRRGKEATFEWDAQKDEAISDNARLRITIVYGDRFGPIQRASTRATSPPFRVRGFSCVWPDGASIKIEPTTPASSTQIKFEGDVITGSGSLTYTWEFGDGETSSSQVALHTYNADTIQEVKLTVTGDECPIGGSTTITRIVKIGSNALDKKRYLPLVLKNAGPDSQIKPDLQISSQVAGLQGHAPRGANYTELDWQPNMESESITEYRIYRRARTDRGPFQHLASVPGDVTRYTDQTAGCGQMYYVTAVNARGESPPSTASYFSLPCQ